MLELLSSWDKQLFFFFNGLHTEWLDTFMYWYTNKKLWIPFYILLIVWMVKEYKWKSIIFILAVLGAVGFADLIISGFMKPFFERFRPSRDPELQSLVHIVRGHRGGSYGFASSHAGTAFALATFIYLLFRENYKWIVWIFLWAGLMSYTRVYIGVHYPGDILVGGIIGALLGYIFYKIATWVRRRYFSDSPSDAPHTSQ